MEINSPFDSHNREIDNIISKYENDLELLKSKSLPKTKTFSIHSIDREQYEEYQDNHELTQEMQNDNLKLQSQLTAADSQIKSLNSTIDSLKGEIDNLNKKIEILQNEIQKKEDQRMLEIEKIGKDKKKEFDEILLSHQEKINTFIKENEKLIELYSINKDLIEQFYIFFNSKIYLFERAEIVENNQILPLKFSDEHNKEIFNLAVNVFDQFLNKMIKVNSEMFNQIVTLNEEIKNQESKYEQEMRLMKVENMKLKRNIGELKEKVIKKQEDDISMLRNISPKKNENSSFSDKRTYTQGGEEIDPIKRLRMRIQDLEYTIQGNTINSIGGQEEHA